MKAAFALVLFLSFGCSAQVYRCADASGKVAYSDNPCPTGAKASQVEGAKSADARELERERAQLARERFRLQQEREAVKQSAQAPAVQVAQPKPVNSYECDIAKKNLGVGINEDSKMRSQRVYETACFGEKAADVEAARAGAPVVNIRIHNFAPQR